MSTFLRQFARSLQTPGQIANGAVGNAALSSDDHSPQPAQAGNTPANTDDTKFATTETVLIKDPDGIDTYHFKAGVEYSFELQVFNFSDLPTSPFFVRFEIGELNWHEDFPVDGGLGPKTNVTAVVKYGTFPPETDVHLSACVYLNSAPDNPVKCAGTANIMVKD